MALRDRDALIGSQDGRRDYSGWVRYFVFGAQWLIFFIIVAAFGVAVYPFGKAKGKVGGDMELFVHSSQPFPEPHYPAPATTPLQLGVEQSWGLALVGKTWIRFDNLRSCTALRIR